MKQALALLMAGAMLPSIALAEKKNAIQRLGESDMPVIRGKLRFTTLIQLPDGDEVGVVTCGDNDSWQIEGKGAVVHLKPLREGVETNLNIVTRNQAIYSFYLKEVSKAGRGEKPDLHILLDPDQISKLRRDKEELEQVLHETEKALKSANEQREKEESKKKEEPPQVESDPTPVQTLARGPSAAEATTPVPPAEAPGSAPSAPQEEASQLEAERPIATAYVIEPKSGLFRRGALALGRLFRKLNERIRLF